MMLGLSRPTVRSVVILVLLDAQVDGSTFCFSSEWSRTDDTTQTQGYCNPSSCGSLGQFMGPMGVTKAFSRTYSNLPTHSNVKVVMELLKVDNFDGETLNLDIDTDKYSVGYD
jgi:hypothetical protein